MKEFVKKKAVIVMDSAGLPNYMDHVLHGAGNVQGRGRAGNVQD